MSSNYYDMRDGKVNIAHALMNHGWKVYGYHADESDSMTDYYSPAYWNGIATKNGYTLVVDHSTAAEPYEVKQYNSKGNLSASDREKIAKLSEMTTARGCTPDEEANAKELIVNISAKIDGNEKYIVVDIQPGYMANPGKCKWHIEKDGTIYDKGTGITKYADIPKYNFDIATEQYTNGYDYYTEWEWVNGEHIAKRTKRTLSDSEQKAVTDFKALILRFERIVNGMNTCGDGTAETAEKAQEQAKNEAMEKVIEKVTKKVTKPIQKTDNTINVNDVLSFSYHGHYWVVAEIWNNSKNVPCATYELLGSEKRGYQRLSGTSLQGKRYFQQISRLEKEIAEGKTKVYTLQEVEETTEVEKWVRKSTYKQPKQKTSESKTTAETEQTNDNASLEYDIKQDVDTRDNSTIYVVKVIKTLSKDEYIKVNNYMRSIGGYYSKFKKGFLFKDDPTAVLNGITQTEQATATEQNNKPNDPYNQTEIEDSYIYSCHFKEWNMTIEEIQSLVNELNINYIDMGDKIGFKGLTAEQTRQVQQISDKNQSIFFVDSKEQAQEQQEKFVPVVVGNFEVSQNTSENQKVFVVKVIKSLTRSDYEKVNKYMQSLGANYNKYLHGFVFADNPIELLRAEKAA